MINELLNRISKYLLITGEGNQNYHKYDALRNHEAWPVYQAFLVKIMNEISSYMLDNQFTKLDKEEKDVQQRAFCIVKEVIEFLLNPLKNAERYVALKEAANKRKAKNSRAQKTPEPKA